MMNLHRLQQAIEKLARADMTESMKSRDRALIRKYLKESEYREASPLARGALIGTLGGLSGGAIGGLAGGPIGAPIGALIGAPLGVMAGMSPESGFGGLSPRTKKQIQQMLLEKAKREQRRINNPSWLERRFGHKSYDSKESVSSKKASLDLSAQRGAALAKAAMADPEFREAAAMMSKEGSFWKNVAVGTAGLAIAPAAYGVGQLGVGAVQKAYQSLTEGKVKAKAYSEMMKVHKKQLGSEDKSKIQTAFNSLWNLNPDLAKDPLVSGTYVVKALDYGGVTAQEAGQIISARKGMGEAKAHEKWMPDTRAIGTATQAFSHAPGMVG